MRPYLEAGAGLALSRAALGLALVAAARIIWPAGESPTAYDPEATIESAAGQHTAAAFKHRAAVPPLPARDIFSASSEDGDGPTDIAPVAARTLAESAPAAPAPSAIQLIGTILDADSTALAIFNAGPGRPRVVRVGGRVGLFRLDSVGSGVAVLSDSTGAARTLRLRGGR